MRRIVISILIAYAGVCLKPTGAETMFDPEDIVPLDAEDLAEYGIKSEYEIIRPHLERYIVNPVEIVETIGDESSRYAVSAGGVTYEIGGPGLPYNEGQHWGRATVAFFEIINNQLEGTGVRFYAISGGNDLGGVFLTAEQYEAAKRNLEQRRDWPYIPVLSHPWYGQDH